MMRTIEQKKKHSDYMKQWRARNKENIAKYMRQWYLNNKERAHKTKRDWVKKNKEHVSSYRSKYYNENKERILGKHRHNTLSYRRARKLIVMTYYGGEPPLCACCGEDKLEFLQLDHIGGGGNKHRKKVGDIYKWVIKNDFPKGFRVLCANCNSSLGFYGYCPHNNHIKQNKVIAI